MAAEGIQVSSGLTINTASFADTDFNWDSIALANANIPAVRRYPGKPIYISQVTPTETGLYFLLDDLTTWQKISAETALKYIGTFDPAVPPVPQVIDGTVNYDSGNLFVCNVAGFYNFTLGDQTPDTGGDNIANLDVGDIIVYNPSDTWEVIESVSLVQSVNGKVGVVVLVAADIGFTNGGTNLVATEVQGAIAELDTRTFDKFVNRAGTTPLDNVADVVFEKGSLGVTDYFGMTFEQGSHKLILFAADSILSVFNSLQFRRTGIDTDKVITYNSDLSGGFVNEDLISKRYDDNHIGGKNTNALIQAPTITEDQFAIIWDQGANEYTLAVAAAVTVLEDRVMFDSNLDAVRVLFYNGVLTFGAFEFDNVQIDNLVFETSLDGITWVNHGSIIVSGTPPGALNTWISSNGSGKWYLRLSVGYETGKFITTGTQWTFTRP